MAGNTKGVLFRLTTFGESHGLALGGVIDGCPPGLQLDGDFIQKELNRRKATGFPWETERKEKDEVEFLSGVLKGKTTGTPIGFLIRNKDTKPEDYSALKSIYRPSHADYSYKKKYGLRDHRGGGRASARETSIRVVAGAIAKLYLKRTGIDIMGWVYRIGDLQMKQDEKIPDPESISSSPLNCPSHDLSKRMISLLEKVKAEGDSVGGAIRAVISGVPAGLGEPVFDKLEADLAKAMLSIGGARGFEIGSGFEGSNMKGSYYNDAFVKNGEKVRTLTNHDGGIQGGISNGMNIAFNVAFKPAATIGKKQKTINLEEQPVEFSGKGRHDICYVPRAVVVVENMSALVLMDHLLRNRAMH
ncbi:MAG: chorismate synthase [Bacteroidales bacterium]|nr:chorismate synthase [Bacteroidales bacterium]MCF8349676.1 chorismate synthase [Bacteroidales bacterium]MCF8374922.1 chorismate synthase [Bacteroidales bacterium]MCF8400099.1 chorismate synthase [Bacteroidales bacterium]